MAFPWLNSHVFWGFSSFAMLRWSMRCGRSSTWAMRTRMAPCHRTGIRMANLEIMGMLPDRHHFLPPWREGKGSRWNSGSVVKVWCGCWRTLLAVGQVRHFFLTRRVSRWGGTWSTKLPALARDFVQYLYEADISQIKMLEASLSQNWPFPCTQTKFIFFRKELFACCKKEFPPKMICRPNWGSIHLHIWGVLSWQEFAGTWEHPDDSRCAAGMGLSSENQLQLQLRDFLLQA